MRGSWRASGANSAAASQGLAERKQHLAAQTAHGEIVRPLFDVAFEVGVGALQIMIGVMHQGCDAQQQRFGVDGVIGILAESAADVGEGGDAAGITGALVDLPAQERRAQVLGTPATHEFDVRQGCFTRAKLEIHTGARQPHAQCLGVMLYGRVIGVQRDLVGALFSQDLAFAKPRFGIVRCQAKGALDQVQRDLEPTLRRRHHGLPEQRFRAFGRELRGMDEFFVGRGMLAEFEVRAAAHDGHFEALLVARRRLFDGIEQRRVLALCEQRIAELGGYFVRGGAERLGGAQFLLRAGGVTCPQARRAQRNARRQVIRILADGVLEFGDGGGDIALSEARQAEFVGIIGTVACEGDDGEREQGREQRPALLTRRGAAPVTFQIAPGSMRPRWSRRRVVRRSTSIAPPTSSTDAGSGTLTAASNTAGSLARLEISWKPRWFSPAPPLSSKS